jgi:hypothetical protein
MYLKGIHIYIEREDYVFLVIDRFILRGSKAFESFSNAFGCIYCVLYRIGSIFEYNSMLL